MKFVSASDLRTCMAGVRKMLLEEKEIVVTANGRPFAILSHVDPDCVEETILSLRKLRAIATLDWIHGQVKAQALDAKTLEEVEAVVAKVRRELPATPSGPSPSQIGSRRVRGHAC